MAVAVASSTASTNTGHSAPKPTGLTVGDLIVVAIMAYTSTDTISRTGWTVARKVTTDSTSDIVTNVAWKVADASDVSASSYAFTNTGGGYTDAVSWRVTGYDPVTPISDSDGVSVAGGTSVSIPSLDVARDGSMVLIAHGGTNGGLSPAYSGFTQDQFFDGANYGFHRAYNAGTTGALTATAATTDYIAAVAVVVQPPNVTLTSKSARKTTTAGSSATNTLTSDSITPTSGKMLLAIVAGYFNITDARFSISDTFGDTGGGAWKQITNYGVSSGYTNRTAIFRRMIGTGGSAGTITVTRTAGTVDQFMAADFYEAAAITGTIGLKQSATLEQAAATIAPNLPYTPQSSNNVVLTAMFTFSDSDVNQPSGFTTIAEVVGGSSCYSAAYKTNATSSGVSWTGAGSMLNTAVAIELAGLTAESTNYVLALHGHSNGDGIFGDGKIGPVDTGGDVAFDTVLPNGPITDTLGVASGYAWARYDTTADYDWTNDIKPVIDGWLPDDANLITVDGFSAGGAAGCEAMRQGWTPPQGTIVGYLFEDAAQAAGTITNPNSDHVAYWASYNGSTWNANDINGFDVIATYESALSITRERMDTATIPGPTNHSPMTGGNGTTSPIAALELLTAAWWATDTPVTGTAATETDTANAGGSTVSATVAGSQASETNAANAGAITVTAQIAGAQATETDTAHVGAVSAGITVAGTQATEVNAANTGATTTLVPGSQATETDAALSGATTIGATVAGAQATETDTATAGATIVVAQIPGSQATETDAANSGGSTVTALIAGTQATESETANAGTASIGITGSQAAEADTAHTGAETVTILVAGTQASETDAAHAGAISSGGIVAGAQATETDSASPGTVAAVLTGTQATETSSATAGTTGAAVTGAQATETDTAHAGGTTVTALIAGTQATETDTARAGSFTAGNIVGGSQVVETDTGHAGQVTLVANLPGSQAVETDTARQGAPFIVVTVAGAQAAETGTATTGGLTLGISGATAAEIDEAFAGLIAFNYPGSRASEVDTAHVGTVNNPNPTVYRVTGSEVYGVVGADAVYEVDGTGAVYRVTRVGAP